MATLARHYVEELRNETLKYVKDHGKQGFNMVLLAAQAFFSALL